MSNQQTHPIVITSEQLEVLDTAAVVLDNPSALAAMPSDDLVALLAQVADVKKVLGDVEGEVKRLVASRMIDETELIGGYAVTRSRKKVEEWDGERARDAARAAIVERLATDPMTGEIHGPLKRVASEAVNLTFGLTSTGAKAKMNITGLKGLSLDPSDVRTITPGEVTISYKLAER